MSYPPFTPILGWWCSGEFGDGDDVVHTLCAVVEADTEEHAKGIIHIEWPDLGEWRFCSEVAGDWSPGDRFPLDDAWMRERFAKAATS